MFNHFRLDVDAPSFSGRIDRVQDKVEHDLREMIVHGAHSRQVVGDFGRDQTPFGAMIIFRDTQRLVDDFSQSHRPRDDRAGSREVDEFAEGSTNSVELPAGEVEFLKRVRIGLSSPEQLDQRRNRRERVADFVRDPRR